MCVCVCCHPLCSERLACGHISRGHTGGRPLRISSSRGVQRLGRAGIRRFRPRGGHQNGPFRGRDYMIPYMVDKLAPNSSHLTRGLVKYVPGRGYFRAVPSQNGDNFFTTLPPPIVERVPPPYGAYLSFYATRLQPRLCTLTVKSDFVYKRLVGLQYYIHR